MPQGVVLASAVVGALGHGYVLDPPSRAMHLIEGVPAGAGGTCPKGVCYWFNQGCTIGCPKCAGANWNLVAKDGCGKDQGKATLPDYARTVWYNQIEPLVKSKDCGINPWCAPGSAPVMSPCGIAGGDVRRGAPGAGGLAPDGYDIGFDGRDIALQRPEFKATWTAGGEAEISWAIIANHGGGYQYRLCPKPLPGWRVAEECFQQMPLEFAEDKQYIQWLPPPGGKFYRPYSHTPPKFSADAGNRTAIPAVDVSVGTVPANSTWRRNPIPACRSLGDGALGFKCGSRMPFVPGTGRSGTDKGDYQFEPVIADAMRTKEGQLLGGFGAGGCYGEPFGRGCGQPPDYGNSLEELWQGHVFQFNIVDQVKVPKVPAGDYVMSFRWDNEQTPQIWSYCSDVTIVDGEVHV